jgi:hypothetical protein
LPFFAIVIVIVIIVVLLLLIIITTRGSRVMETRTFCFRSLSRRALQLGLAPKKSMVATEPFVDDFLDEARRDAEKNWVMIKIESKCR